MDMSLFTLGETELLATLKLLGKDWFRSQRVPPHGEIKEWMLEFSIHPPEIAMPAELRQIARRILELCASNTHYSVWMSSLSGALVDGPKVITTNAVQCEAMYRTDVNFYPTDYLNPFPTTIVQIDEGFAKRKAKELDVPSFPYYVFIRNTKDVLFITAWYPSGDQTALQEEDRIPGTTNEDLTGPFESHRWFPKVERTTFEEGFTLAHQGRKKTWDDDLADQSFRIALNLCMWATHTGVHKTRWTSGSNRARNVKLAHKPIKSVKDEKKTVKARQWLANDIETYGFAQTVQMHEEVTEGNSGVPEEKTGRTVAVHWRRGYWRRQWYGPMEGVRHQKLIPIAAILVNAHKFAGDKGDTSATYEPPRKKNFRK